MFRLLIVPPLARPLVLHNGLVCFGWSDPPPIRSGDTETARSAALSARSHGPATCGLVTQLLEREFLQPRAQPPDHLGQALEG
jgi:hypothetical protein